MKYKIIVLRKVSNVPIQATKDFVVKSNMVKKKTISSTGNNTGLNNQIQANLKTMWTNLLSWEKTKSLIGNNTSLTQ